MNTDTLSEIEKGIKQRFFSALDTVINMRLIRGVQTFTREHNLNRRNIYKTKDPESNLRVQSEWIYFLCTDFNISADWIITGRGSMFK